MSGGIPAVSSSAWVNGESVCMYQEEIFPTTLRDSESSHFSFFLRTLRATAWDPYLTPTLCMLRCKTPLCIFCLLTPESLPIMQGPKGPFVWVLGDGFLQDCLYQTKGRRCPDYEGSGRYGSLHPRAQEWTLKRITVLSNSLACTSLKSFMALVLRLSSLCGLFSPSDLEHYNQ